jgi:hypothetical protein
VQTQASAPSRQELRQQRALQQRQDRVQRLQERVQRLQTQQPQSARAQRAQQRLLQAQQRVLDREQRLLQRQQARQGVQPTTTTAPATIAAPTTTGTVNQQSAARGRFAAPFVAAAAAGTPLAQSAQAALTVRANGWPARRAWRQGLLAAFVPWLGPLFWPYAYSDIFDYTFWPYAYDEGYWAYAYDDFVDAMFWPSGGPYSTYAYGYGPEAEQIVVPGRRRSVRAAPSAQTVQQLCGDPDKGITAWPFAAIEQAVQPTAEQRALLDEMRNAAARAAEAFKASCGGSFALTPPGRLQAMAARIDATLEAVHIVRPALERFYNSLSDEQKARFNTVGPQVGDRNAPRDAAQRNASACGEPKPGLINVPIERIDESVRPTGSQRDALERLRAATDKALAALQAACPEETPLTPVGRLEAMEKRLQAMSAAAKTVLPALEQFYTSLGNEQKARFNTLSAQARR